MRIRIGKVEQIKLRFSKRLEGLNYKLTGLPEKAGIIVLRACFVRAPESTGRETAWVDEGVSSSAKSAGMYNG